MAITASKNGITTLAIAAIVLSVLCVISSILKLITNGHGIVWLFVFLQVLFGLLVVGCAGVILAFTYKLKSEFEAKVWLLVMVLSVVGIVLSFFTVIGCWYAWSSIFIQGACIAVFVVIVIVIRKEGGFSSSSTTTTTTSTV